MIYIDSSVVLAHLLGADRRPPERLWGESLVSSRLLEYESWNRVHRFGIADSRGPALRELIDRIALAELSSQVLTRALEPFPVPVRTLDALHLATLEYLRSRKKTIRLATYDSRMVEVAHELKVPLESL